MKNTILVITQDGSRPLRWLGIKLDFENGKALLTTWDGREFLLKVSEIIQVLAAD